MAEPVLVIHFTQGTTIAGAVAAMRQAKSECHEVVDPAKPDPNGYATTLQLLPWGTPARSLKHPAGTPHTNNRGWPGGDKLGRCYQVEVVGFSETAAIYPDDWYARLAAYLRDRCATLGVPYVFPCQFTGVQAYGASAPQRLDWTAWATVAGIVGHQHVPGNAHWDPGPLSVTRLTKETTVPTPPTANRYPLETAEALELLAQHAGYVGDRLWFGPDALAALHRLKNAWANAESHVQTIQGEAADLRKTTATNADTITRLAGERDTARANREAAEAEVAQLRKQLQEGGRLPALLAAIDMASTDIGRAWDDLNEAVAKARA